MGGAEQFDSRHSSQSLMAGVGQISQPAFKPGDFNGTAGLEVMDLLQPAIIFLNNTAQIFKPVIDYGRR